VSYPTYSSYKSAQADWIENIPSHWEEWKISHGCGLIGSGTTPKSDNGLYYGGNTLWVTTAELRESVVYDTTNHVTSEALLAHSTLRKYPPGSVVMAMYGATIGRLGMLGNEATVNQACCVFSFPEKFQPRFLYFWLWMRRPILISLSSGGGQPNLNQEDLKRLRVPIPSISEQQQIATFLDWKTGQIDALIAKKRELMGKLKEKRLAVITQAVTKGLDSAVPMRNSGIPWLGDMPEHWEVRRLKFTAKEPLMYGANEAAELDDPEFPRYIRITDVKDDGTLYDETFRSLPPEVAAPYLLKDGDILLARSGATVGKSFQYLEAWGIAAFAGYLIRFRVDPAVIRARFAYYFMRSEFYWACINASLIQATIQNFSAEKYASISMTIPPLDEQEKIAVVIEGQMIKIDKLEDATRQAISRLTEYRTALITAATTGKIDVRQVAVPATT
jgi:type I restriction enzyme, S subunit